MHTICDHRRNTKFPDRSAWTRNRRLLREGVVILPTVHLWRIYPCVCHVFAIESVSAGGALPDIICWLTSSVALTCSYAKFVFHDVRLAVGRLSKSYYIQCLMCARTAHFLMASLQLDFV